jgi:small conductance mechanosensitive channel
MFKDLNPEKVLKYIEANLLEVLTTFLISVVILIFGLKVISFLTTVVKKVCEKKSLEKGLVDFIAVSFSLILKIVLTIGILSYIGFDTTSLSALVASAGLAIGFALKGSLSNLAGGVLIVAFKPFKIGEFISAQGESGTVSEIKLMNTILLTPDNKTVFLPNGPLSTGKVTNFSRQDFRRVDLVFGIGYDDDLKKAKELLTSISKEDQRVLSDKPVTIAVNELADSSVNFVYRVFVKKENYWAVYWDTIEKVKLTFDENGISIPFPQRDIHLHQVEN